MESTRPPASVPPRPVDLVQEGLASQAAAQVLPEDVQGAQEGASVLPRCAAE